MVLREIQRQRDIEDERATEWQRDERDSSTRGVGGRETDRETLEINRVEGKWRWRETEAVREGETWREANKLLGHIKGCVCWGSWAWKG